MMEYKYFVCNSNYIMHHGKYKGETLRFIYIFDPEYIQWLVYHRKPFMILISDFKNYVTHSINRWHISAPKGFVSFEGKKLKLRDYIENHTNLIQELSNQFLIPSYPFDNQFMGTLKSIERRIRYTYKNMEKFKYNQLIHFKIDEEEYETNEYERSYINAIENNAASNDKLTNFIEESNRDFYVEFNGFYHEDME